MKNRYVTQRTILALLILLVGFLGSCDNNEEDSGEVLLESFGPSNVLHGEEMIIVGRNLNKVTSVILPANVEVLPSSFKEHTSDKIVLDVPLETGYGKVTLKTPQGDIISKSIYSPEAPIEITAVTAEAKPGTTITITGDFLDFVGEVWFADGVSATEFVSQSRNELVVMVPMAAQTGAIAVARVDVGPEGLTVESEEDLIVTLPTTTSVTPTTVKQTDNITIVGTDLDLITEIVFGGNVSTSEFVSQSEIEIVVAVPVGALNGKVTLKQASPVSITTSQSLTVILPKATTLAPKPATPGTDNITITGTDLDLVAELTLTGVAVPITSVQFVSQTATQIVLALPATAINGPVVYKSIHGYSSNLGVSVSIPTAGPPPLDYYIYDDAFKNGWAKWDGWGTTVQDPANAEEVFKGTKAIKVTYNNTWGALQLGSPATNVFSGYTKLSFRVYAPAAQNFIIQIGDGADYGISIPAGWSKVEIPVANIDGHANVGELRFKNNNAALPVTLYFDEIGLML